MSPSTRATVADVQLLSGPTVDVHTHVYLPSYIDYLRSRKEVPRIFRAESGEDRLVILPGEDKDSSTAKGRPIGKEYYDVDTKLEFMDVHKIDASVISLANPWLDFMDPSTASPLAAQINSDLQSICAKDYGDDGAKKVLYGLGCLPTTSVEGSVKALEHLAEMDRMRGVLMGTYGKGKGLDDPEFEPVFAKAEELGLPIFIHPHYGIPSEMYGDMPNGHVMSLALGFPFETTISITRIILAGVLDRYPKLKLILAHSGGVAPYLVGRLDSCVKHDRHISQRLKKPPSEVSPIYLKSLYYDAVSYNPAPLRSLCDLVGSDRVMFGTDNPFFPPLEGISGRWESVDTNYGAIAGLENVDWMKGVKGTNAARILDLHV
ncbi:amidohydrolase 2 [Gonapodya prolifera JEL478]|uniref:Amidohydrolase 2 n=1 Tax=Gonapodya prolifera (strain JEL478) TaxID=1344416 RepID=A0A138ZY85_GONPJ|nr:amidohydrolase 2 [Gonapodya prolifera JEL478]|eukprot:KXS09457.1 amidohydrolase 2 [Gonapodya prolifera JEL478]